MIIDLRNKKLKLFDSSLYHDKKIFGNFDVEMLNKNNLQMYGTCSYWMIGVCSVLQDYLNVNMIENDCKSGLFQLKVATKICQMFEKSEEPTIKYPFNGESRDKDSYFKFEVEIDGNKHNFGINKNYSSCKFINVSDFLNTFRITGFLKCKQPQDFSSKTNNANDDSQETNSNKYFKIEELKEQYNISLNSFKNKQIEEENNAKERIRKALRNIDDYVKSRSRELANSWADGLKLHFSDISTYGVGRPWGTEIRQRLATAFGLKKEVNSLWELGLNSLANSQHVYLGEHFIGLIKQDPAMEKIREHITRKVISDIRSRAYHVPYLTIQSFEGRISGMKPEEFGGKRSSDDMIQQLKFTLRHPISSFSKYADTWNAAINELTWTIRHATVKYNGIYHVIYNYYGFMFIWEVECSLEDTYDLRPRNGKKIDFQGAYNIVTSILGTAYHDLCGNTDKMRIRAYWNEMKADATIYSW